LIKLFDDVRETAVGVQFDRISERLNFVAKFRKILLQGGLSAGDADCIQKPPAFFEVCHHLVFLDFFASAQNQCCIVAEGTAEIAARCKDRADNLFAIVHHGKFFYARDFHEKIIAYSDRFCARNMDKQKTFDNKTVF
jgi:hypothetical protein